MKAIFIITLIGGASAFMPTATGPSFMSSARTMTAPTMGIFDNIGKGSFFEDETPLSEPKKFQERTLKQNKALSPGVRAKLVKESAAADSNQANRGVLYAVGIVAALVVAGGNGILYNTEPGVSFSPIGADQMREAAEFPVTADMKKAAPPTYGTSSGVQTPAASR